MARSRNGLSTLEERAIRVVAPRGVRQPKELAREHRALADRALQRIVDVMEEEVHSKRAKGVLSAAIEIREELCGPKTQKIQIEGSLESILTASLAPADPSAVDVLPSGGRDLRLMASEFQSPDEVPSDRDREPADL